MDKKYIMAIDQGTSGTRVIIFNHEGSNICSASREIEQIFPNPGWVEHSPGDYISTIMDCIGEVLKKSKVSPGEIAAIGIANQRETTILWDRDTGEPIYNAIVWQCRRSAGICEDLKAKGLEQMVKEKTGLVVDAYFSGTKIKWIIDNVPGVKQKIKQKKILMGNVDSWIIWNLSGRKYHVTDASNASRTMLFNINTLMWDNELLEMLDIDESILPEVLPSSGIMAVTDRKILGEEIPIAGDAGDQHAALFGQCCFEPGMVKNTYGTALALMMNIGGNPSPSKHGLTTDLAWQIGNKVVYSFEGLVFIGGATVQWLRDGLKIIDDASQTDMMARKVPDTGNLYMVPAFTGLSAPYWDMYARGIIIGITRGTTREHIARSALEAIAYQTRDIMDSMEADSGQSIRSLRVDGGATSNDFLMQFQSDILGIPVEKPIVTEMTALGAAYLAGLGIGFWESTDEIGKHWQVERVYEPDMSEDRREELYSGWKKAVKRSLGWAK